MSTWCVKSLYSTIKVHDSLRKWFLYNIKNNKCTPTHIYKVNRSTPQCIGTIALCIVVCSVLKTRADLSFCVLRCIDIQNKLAA